MRFEDLNVWQRSVALSSELYLYFKNCSDYGFKDQITRAGLSIPSNIAEGHERSSPKDFIKFLTYSRGSCGEVRTQLIIALNIGYIETAIANQWIQETIEISQMLSGLMKARSKFIN